MTTIEPTGQILGATVRGVDLAKPLGDEDFATIVQALGQHGVLRFPEQRLEAAALRDFSRRFGAIQAMLTRLPRARHAGSRHPLERHRERSSRSAWPMPGRTGTPTCPTTRPSGS